ncbi:MAG: protein kinase [Nannocystis sp.]|nr:protein kinase [Nannocystis sp.]
MSTPDTHPDLPALFSPWTAHCAEVDDEATTSKPRHTTHKRLRVPPLDRSGELFAEHWELRRRLGVGGMAEVYEALNLRDRERYAIKILTRVSDHLHTIERFRNEYLALTKIDHPGVIKAYASGFGDGREWFTMELVEGRALDDLLRERRRLPVDQVLELGIQICDALIAVHERGIVHRDIKPGNILVAWTPGAPLHAKLIDFGIAKLLPPFYAHLQAPTEHRLRLVTKADLNLGTEGYIPTSVRDLFERDLFALSKTLFFAGVGRLPRPADLAEYAQGCAPERRPEGWPATLDHVLFQAFHDDPGRRTRTIRELRDGLIDVRDELALDAAAERSAIPARSLATVVTSDAPPPPDAKSEASAERPRVRPALRERVRHHIFPFVAGAVTTAAFWALVHFSASSPPPDLPSLASTAQDLDQPAPPPTSTPIQTPTPTPTPERPVSKVIYAATLEDALDAAMEPLLRCSAAGGEAVVLDVRVAAGADRLSAVKGPAWGDIETMRCIFDVVAALRFSPAAESATVSRVLNATPNPSPTEERPR